MQIQITLPQAGLESADGVRTVPLATEKYLDLMSACLFVNVCVCSDCGSRCIAGMCVSSSEEVSYILQLNIQYIFYLLNVQSNIFQITWDFILNIFKHYCRADYIDISDIAAFYVWIKKCNIKFVASSSPIFLSPLC